jgi:uncharacterized protein
MKSFPALAAILFATSALAGPMMPVGPSPDVGFAGVWRIIAAKSAPWAKPRTLTKTDAPLLEFAADFENGVVKGPAPLACAQAKYSAGVTYRDELFAGRLAGNDAGAKALGLSQPSTWRVVCGAAVHDYYMDEHADIVMAEGDVIYTLERPTGMDPEQYKAGFSGPSFDCTRAKTTAERLICSDAALAASDRRLGVAWRAIKASVSADSFATVAAAQRAWIAHVTRRCGADVAMPDTEGDRSPIAECLNTEYGERAQVLEGVKAVRSGALVLEPRMRFRARATPDTEETDIAPRMDGGPQANAFNAYIARTLRLDRWRMDDKTVFRYGDDVEDMKLHAERFYSVDRFDGRVLALAIGTSDYVGGHDEEYGGFTVNWDLARSKPIGFNDVFAKGADWTRFAAKFCLGDLGRQTKAEDKPADLDIADVTRQVSSVANWLWGKTAATVMFTVFMNSGMPAEGYTVRIPYRTLKPFMKPDAPVL